MNTGSPPKGEATRAWPASTIGNSNVNKLCISIHGAMMSERESEEERV
jgi:hypothetical protein